MGRTRTPAATNGLEQDDHRVDGRGENAAAYLRRVLGPRLTAIIAQVPNPDDIELWASGRQAPTPESARHLNVAYQVSKLLEPYETPETVQAWFVGMNPVLGDRAPALVVADDPDAVMQAARAFVAYG